MTEHCTPPRPWLPHLKALVDQQRAVTLAKLKSTALTDLINLQERIGWVVSEEEKRESHHRPWIKFSRELLDKQMGMTLAQLANGTQAFKELLEMQNKAQWILNEEARAHKA